MKKFLKVCHVYRCWSEEHSGIIGKQTHVEFDWVCADGAKQSSLSHRVQKPLERVHGENEEHWRQSVALPQSMAMMDRVTCCPI
jgi:hypothetical protein